MRKTLSADFTDYTDLIQICVICEICGSNDSPVVPEAHRTEADVEVAEADPEEAGPGPVHVPAIQATRAVICLVQRRPTAELIDPPADQVPQRVAPERVAAEQDHVQRQHQRADADAERSFS